MQYFRFVCLAFALTLLSGCLLLTKTGTVVIDRKPYELSITETSALNTGYLVKINGEEVGTLTAKDRSFKSVEFYPLETKYGTLVVEWKSDVHLIDSDINFRFFLNGEYIGTVQYM